MRSTTQATLAGLVSLVLVVAGCSATSPGGSAQKQSESGLGSTPSPTLVPGETAPPINGPASPDAWLAVGREGSPGLEVILASTREVIFDLPTGVPIDSRWGRILTAASSGGKTVVRDLVVQPGFGGTSISVDGAWHLPTIGSDPLPVGVSVDGQTIVLAEALRPGTGGVTRFALLGRDFVRPARIVTLHGRFDYDALSPDGATLYVVEHLDAAAGGRYQVRAVDVASGSLRAGVVANKSQVIEGMAGYPLAQVRREDGVVLTLYRGREHPFIHLLDSAEGWAVCLDLPANGAQDVAAAADWGFSPSPDGRFVYAVNVTLGLVVEVDPAQLAVVRTATVKPLADGRISLAKFGHETSGPAGRRVVVSPDGRRIYAAGVGGILEIDAATFTAIGTYERGQAVDALAVTPDGGTLFALLHAGGHIVKLDPSTGTVLATVPGAGYDRLVAVMPW